jgi:hypothetical protein
VAEVVEYASLVAALADCRIGWMPQTGKGSQGSELAGYRAISNFILEMGVEMEERWEQ